MMRFFKHKQQVKHEQQGFTLIEVLVALTIFTVAAAAASSASMNYTRTTESLRTKTLAHFVAKNRMADVMINNEWSQQNQQQKQTKENGGRWQIQQTNQKIQNNDALKRITLSVAPIDESTNQPKNTVTDLVFYVAKPAVKKVGQQTSEYVFE